MKKSRQLHHCGAIKRFAKSCVRFMNAENDFDRLKRTTELAEIVMDCDVAVDAHFSLVADISIIKMLLCRFTHTALINESTGWRG